VGASEGRAEDVHANEGAGFPFDGFLADFLVPAVTLEEAMDKSVPKISGASVFFGNGCDNFTDGQLARMGVSKSDTKAHADILVVSVLEEAPKKFKFVARLTGALLATSQFLKTSGQRGACLKFHSAVQTKRMVFLSDGFLNDHPLVSKDFVDVLQMVCCSWTLSALADIRKYLGEAGPQRERRQREVLAFMTKDEKTNEVRNATT
jgi:D-Tyr-tRNAtyr deacylase